MEKKMVLRKAFTELSLVKSDPEIYFLRNQWQTVKNF
jgi:hypothetical protein